jgi:hypothetical protein
VHGYTRAHIKVQTFSFESVTASNHPLTLLVEFSFVLGGTHYAEPCAQEDGIAKV